MAIATTLKDFLDSHALHYDAVRHRHSQTSREAASAAHQPGSKVAKVLLCNDGERYLLVVLPADRRLHLGRLHSILGRHVGLATEDEVGDVFEDCALGAIPPAGPLYDLDTVVDDALLEQDEVYFEAGDHEQLVHMLQPDFRKLLGDAQHGDVSDPV